MSHRVTTRFQRLVSSTWSDVDPDADGENYKLTLEIKADGAGAEGDAIVAYSEDDTDWQDYRKAAGQFYYDLDDLDDATWYEAWWTWTRNGSETKNYRPVFYRDTGAEYTSADAPTLTSVTNDGDGDALTVTVAPATGETTTPIRVLYRKFTGSFASAGTRTGAGTVAISDLDNNTAYCIVAQHENASDANVKSYPSKETWIVCHDTTTLGASVVSGVLAALRGNANLAAYADNWAKTDSRRHVFDGIEDGWVGGRSPGRAPFIEVEVDAQSWPIRPRGDVRGIDQTLRVQLRCTHNSTATMSALVSDTVRCLQLDANRYLGMSSNLVSIDPSAGSIEDALLVQRQTIALDIRLIGTPGVTA